MKSQAVVSSCLFSVIINFVVFASNPSEEPKTIDEAIFEIKLIFKELHLQFRPNVSNEEIIFGLQHTIADQRQPESEKGQKFPVTPEYLSKVIKYYQNFVNVILTNKSDCEVVKLYVSILSDLTITRNESKFMIDSEVEIQARNKLGTRGYFVKENRQDQPTQVNTDQLLLVKDKDGMNEGLGFTIDGKELILMKQYLASLLEPMP